MSGIVHLVKIHSRRVLDPRKETISVLLDSHFGKSPSKYLYA